MGYYRRKRVSFRASKVVRVPVRVKFRTYDGRTVSFRATKAVRKPTNVSFYAKKRRRRWY